MVFSPKFVSELAYIHLVLVLVLVLLSILSKRQGCIKGQACKHTPPHISTYKLQKYKNKITIQQTRQKKKKKIVILKEITAQSRTEHG